MGGRVVLAGRAEAVLQPGEHREGDLMGAVAAHAWRRDVHRGAPEREQREAAAVVAADIPAGRGREDIDAQSGAAGELVRRADWRVGR